MDHRPKDENNHNISIKQREKIFTLRVVKDILGQKKVEIIKEITNKLDKTALRKT